MNLVFWHDGEEVRLSLEEKAGNIFQAVLGGRAHAVRVEFLNTEELLLNVDGRVFNIIIHSDARSHSVFVSERFFMIEKKSAFLNPDGGAGKSRKREVKTTMPGRIVRLLAREGDDVREGQAVVVLEAMKMQNEIKSPRPGRITRLRLEPGDHVEAGALLFAVE